MNTMRETSDTNQSFLPDFCSVRTLFLVVLIAELLAIILSLAQTVNYGDRLFDLAMKSLFVQWIALTSVGLLCLLRRLIKNFKDSNTALFAYSLILLVAFIITELGWWFIYVQPEQIPFFSPLHTQLLIRSLGITAIVAAIVLRYLYVQHQWRRNVETAAQSRFQALQSRIRPHFLFNCMNTIASLTRKHPEIAEQAIEDLADLFRASLLDPSNLSRLKNEINLCDQYLRIEKHRLGDRLSLEWDIDPLPDDALIPSLTLQPLLENAIYHGIELIEQGGTIKISGKLDNNIIRILVTNPLPEDIQYAPNPGHHLAQENIRQRLHAVYGKDGKLLIEQDKQYYLITLCFPYQTNEDFNC